MNDLKRCLPWIVLAIVAAVAISWAFPKAFPLFPRQWSVTGSEAKAIALERFDALGDPVEGGFVAARMLTDNTVEWRIQQDDDISSEAVRSSQVADLLTYWRVTVHAPGAQPPDWTYRAYIALDGRVIGLLKRIDPDAPGGSISEPDAVEAADRYLERQGFDLGDYDRPEIRGQQLERRTDLQVRYRNLEQVLGPDTPYGVSVRFSGDQLVGFTDWYDEPTEKAIEAEIAAIGLFEQIPFLMIFIFTPLIGIVFLRRYHAGEVGVRRSLQILLLVLTAGAGTLINVAVGMTDTQNWGILTRQQIALLWPLQFFFVFFVALALLAFFGWSVGESSVREGWSRKLAAFDALFQGDWRNATVARASVRGLSAGLILVAVFLVACVALSRFGAWAVNDMVFNAWLRSSTFPGLTILLMSVVMVLARELSGRLFLLPWLTRRLGLRTGAVLAGVSASLLLYPSFLLIPARWAFFFILAFSAFMVVLFLVYDLLTVLIASFLAEAAIASLGLIHASDPSLQFQGWLVLAVAALPAALSIRFLGSGREFVYYWDDIPPHVRRIADRERQRVELETARNIQSSILPDLPPTLAGVDLAHAYLPASEVGGDFYDVLALEDGRLAVAVGDVAGHGVSSGLVMSAAKSALAVQVTFDPDVVAVFQTLNRMVYQSARKRLLATLCYAVLDPVRREMSFGSAGHLFPYVVGSNGRIRSLESVAYPLGVRGELDINVTKVSLDPGDTLVLFSDGLIEAHAEGSDEQFGFQRFEESLLRHVPGGVNRVRDGILADVNQFVGSAPRDDDQTILVLKLP